MLISDADYVASIYYYSMVDAALEMCTRIASKSPVAVQGTKLHLNYSRDHTVDESLEYQVKVIQVFPDE